MIIPQIAVKRSVMTVMLMSAIMIFGLIGLSRMGISQYPDVEFPSVSVTTMLPGASPDVVDREITDKIEEYVNSIQGIKHITSTSLYGMSRVVVEFQVERDIDVAAQDVREQVAFARMYLPREIENPIIRKENPMDQPIMWVAVMGDKPIGEISDWVENIFNPRLQTLNGVGSIFIGGKRLRMVRIWIDPKTLDKYGVTVMDVANALSKGNVEIPGGTLESSSVEITVKTLGEVANIEEFSKIVVSSRDGVPVYLKDVVRIEDGLEDLRVITRYSGKNAIGVGIRKQRGANTVAVADLIKAQLAKLSTDKAIPDGLTLQIAFDSSLFIKESIAEIEFALIIGAILAALVVFVFLRSFGSTIIISLAIPTSIVGTFAFMYFAGFTLNTMTMLALSLSVGVVIDDAIIVLENIYRHREEGAGMVEGAINGASEISFAAMAATFSLIAVFVPIAFVKGLIGKFFYEFGLTVAVAIAISLVVSLTLTPMLCSKFLKPTNSKGFVFRVLESGFVWMESFYKVLLGFSLRHRLVVIGIALISVFGSYFLVKGLGKEMFPSEDMSMFMVKMDSPIGSSLEYNTAVLKEIEKPLLETPEVKGVFEAVGLGMGGVGQVNQGIMFVTMVPIDQRTKTQRQVMDELRVKMNSIPGTTVRFIDISSAFGGGASSPVNFSIKGPELEKLEIYSAEIMKRLSSNGGYVDLDTDFDRGVPEARLIPDRDKAADLGVDVSSIGTTINYLVAGKNVTKFKAQGNQYDVRIQLEKLSRTEKRDLYDLTIRSSRNQLVRLSDVVKVEEGGGLSTIYRKDREKSITITGSTVKSKTQNIVIDEVQKAAEDILPEGYRVSFAGSAEMFRESMPSMIFALVLSILITYMVLASQFNSFMHPLTIMIALPLSLIGAFGALMIVGATISMISMIGLILLMGLVTKNSILLVDYTNLLRDQGLSMRDALAKACPVRLRPILMTAVSTICGIIPVAFGIGPGSESRAPMGFAIGGGMLTSTLLTLLVVPVVYSLFDDALSFFKRLFGAKK